MKKIIYLIFTSLIIFTSTLTVNLIWDLAISSVVLIVNGWLMGNKAVIVSTTFWQFGTQTTFSNGLPPIFYYYGSEDLCCYGKRNLENNVNNEEVSSETGIYIYIYEADDITNSNYKKYIKVKNKSEFKVENLDLNLEKWKLYFIVYCNENGDVLDMQKIIITG